MALGKRLTIQSSDIDGNNTYVDIYLEGYTGSVVTRQAGPGSPTITWGDKSAEGLPIVYGSEAKFSFVAETDYESADLFTTSPNDTYAEIRKESVLGNYVMWKGHLDTEQYTEPLISPNYIVELSAFDGLGNLKNQKFVQSDGTPYEGFYTLLNLLSEILQKTGLQLPIYTAVLYRQKLLLENNLSDTRIYAPRLSDKNCYDIVKEIFADCRLMQRNGKWYIFNNLAISEQYATGSTSLNFQQYDYQGNSTGDDVVTNLDATGWWIEDIAELKKETPIRQITFQQDFGKTQNLFENPTFQNDGESWTEIGGVTTLYSGWDITESVYLSGIEKPSTPGNITKAISQTIEMPATSNILKFNFNFAVIGTHGTPAPVYVKIRTDVSGTTYTVQKNSDDTYEFKPGDYAILLENQDAKLLAEAVENTQSKAISVYGIPEAGDVTIELLVPYTDENDITGILWKTPQATIVSTTDDAPKSQTLSYLISDTNIKTIEGFDSEGDIPDITDNEYIYEGGLRKVDTSATDLWKIDQDVNTYYEFAEMAIRMMGSHYRSARTAYQITLANLSLGMNIILTDPNNSNIKLIESGVTYNDQMRTYEGSYVEVLSIDMSAGSLSKAFDSEGSSSGSTGGSGGGTGGGSGEPNVQSDWNESNTLSDAYIKNKPNLSSYALESWVNDNFAAIDHTHSQYLVSSDLNGYATELWVNDNFAAIGHTHSQYLTDADADGNVYGRRDNAWFDMTPYTTWKTDPLLSTVNSPGNSTVYEILYQENIPLANGQGRVLKFHATGLYTGQLNSSGNKLWIKLDWKDADDKIVDCGTVEINAETGTVTDEPFAIEGTITVRADGTSGKISSHIRAVFKDRTYQGYREEATLNLTGINKITLWFKTESIGSPDYELHQAFLLMNP